MMRKIPMNRICKQLQSFSEISKHNYASSQEETVEIYRSHNEELWLGKSCTHEADRCQEEQMYYLLNELE